MDFSHIPPGGTELVHHIDEVEIPLVTDPARCAHDDTLCPECAALWQTEHLLSERLPWEQGPPDPTDAERDE
ncbi:hypothetical protein [Nocardia sp. NPDC059195]|uniref:hypothetical protein n=1 Tax=Nocardia sp. NPDC059195 TaxID=3346765 RepID=UPI0036B16810